MTPPRQRKTSGAGPAEPPQIQPNFPPNPVRPKKLPREEPVERLYVVTGRQAVGEVAPGGRVWLKLTDAQETALLASGNARVVTQAELEKDQPPEDREQEEPMTGAEKEGD